MLLKKTNTDLLVKLPRNGINQSLQELELLIFIVDGFDLLDTRDRIIEEDLDILK